MTGHDVIFILVALLTAGAAVLTVTSKNLVHAALFLAVTLAGIAGVFLTLAADFLALVQLVVYVGAVAVLFLFGLMLTRAPIGREALDNQNRGFAIAVSGSLFVVLSGLIIGAVTSGAFGDGPFKIGYIGIEAIGIAIFADWVLPFEVLSMLLLAALIGAIVLARREDGDSGEEAGATRIALGDPPPGMSDTDYAIDRTESAQIGSGGAQ
ncbi:MAG: NADH-quinone oxidoreductase subunit J [Nitriliruptoraceae bacterium]